VALIAACELDDQAKVGVDEPLLGSQVAALDALCELDLLLASEQGVPTRLVQEELEAVGGLGCGSVIRAAPLEVIGERRVECVLARRRWFSLRWVSAPLDLGIRLLVELGPCKDRRDTYATVRRALLRFRKYSNACLIKQAQPAETGAALSWARIKTTLRGAPYPARARWPGLLASGS